MILIGGDKYPQSMTGVKDLTDADLDTTIAVMALNLWAADIPDISAGSIVDYPQVFTYPANASGYWLTPVSSDSTVLKVNTAQQTLEALQPGTVSLLWNLENADESVVTYSQTVQVVLSR